MPSFLATRALLALLALPSSAGELAVEAQAGYFQMAAENSASALFGSRGGPTFGGAVRYTFWRGAFVSAGARTFSKEGERVFVSAPNSPEQKLGFPLSMRITPILVTVGYRFRGNVRFGAEMGFSAVSDALGLGGVSMVYGEDDLGGFHAAGKLMLAF
jgi:hypothetical protein